MAEAITMIQVRYSLGIARSIMFSKKSNRFSYDSRVLSSERLSFDAI